MDLINLRPCPFCGGTAELGFANMEDGAKTYSIICPNCRTGIFRPRTEEWRGYANIYEAVAAWNRRAEDGDL